MSRPFRIEGYAVVSTDGMIADAQGAMPDTLRIEADQRFFHSGVDRADAVVHGRHSAEGGPNAAQKPRIVVTHRVPTVAPDPSNAMAVLWNPQGATIEQACGAIGLPGGVLAVVGGTQVFEMFLGIGYDAFYLSRAPQAYLPAGRPVFANIGPQRTPEDVLSGHGLVPGETMILDTEAGVTVVRWEPRSH